VSPAVARILPIAVVVALVFVIRLRRMVGPQVLVASRLWRRMAIWAVLGVIVAAAAAADPIDLGVAAAALVVGGALGVYALRLTQFRQDAQGRLVYVPHTYLSLIMLALFVLRVIQESASSGPTTVAASSNILALMSSQYRSDPLAVGLLFAYIGYWVAYYVGLLRRAGAPPVGNLPDPSGNA
jgi:hypothetical protein